MTAAPMIRFFLRMALVLFSFSLIMLVVLERGTEEFTLTLYSFVMSGTFAAALAVWIRMKGRQHENDEDQGDMYE